MILKKYPGLSLYGIAPDGYAVTIKTGQVVPFENSKIGKVAKLKTDETIGKSKTRLIRSYTSEELSKMYDSPKSEIIVEQRASNEVSTNPESFTIAEPKRRGRPKKK